MSVTLFPAKIPRKPVVKSHRLNEIASVLGVPLDTFTNSAKPHVLYTGNDGKRWLLEINDQSVPVVRIDVQSEQQKASCENISSFINRDIGTPQHQALINFIENILVMHLLR